MNDAEERFAERLAEDLQRVLGVGIVVRDVDLEVSGGEPGGARVIATLLAGARTETIEATGDSVLALYEPIVRRAAELRLRDAYWQIIGPA
jgi:hypothetical protein